jgi:hypothetical protein
MQDQTKMGAILLAGYLLGRTKKGGMALRFAARMMMSGQDVRPTALARDNAMKILQSAGTAALIDQVREQAMETFKATLDARLEGAASALSDRTEALKAPKQTLGLDDEEEEAEEPEPGDEEEPEEEPEEDEEEPEDEEEEEEEEPAKKAPAKKTAKKATKKAPAKKSTTKKAAR